MVDAVRARDFDRPVSRSVVDHQPFDAVEALNGARKVPQRGWQLLLLVEAGDLDDQLHAPGYCGGALGGPPTTLAEPSTNGRGARPPARAPAPSTRREATITAALAGLLGLVLF